MILKTSQNTLENKYEISLFEEDKKLIRRTVLIGILMYSFFAITDVLLNIESLNLFLLIRLGIVFPYGLIVYALSYNKNFFRYHQYLLTTLYTISGIGIVIMLVLEPSIFSYYGGLFLVFAYGAFLLRIKWEFVTVGSTAIMIFYFIVSFLHSDENLFNYLIYSIFYINFNIIAIFGNYAFSNYRKKHYLQETTLKGDNIILEKQNYDNLIDIENSNYITIYALAKLAESRDSLTGDHIDRVASLSLNLSNYINESIYKKNYCVKLEFIQSIELASTLHDIGKIGIPENILNFS